MSAEKYNCLVVDDEPIARKLISNYIEQVPFLSLASEEINALNAIEYLRTHANVDFIFLDINMPNLSGMQLVRILQPHQPVIFTTAYQEHAVESYELDAVDYLLKPFSFERFMKAVYKGIEAIRGARNNPPAEISAPRQQIFIKSDGMNFPVYVDEIIYCEARKNYTMVVLPGNQKLMPLVSLSKFESLLANAGATFLQVHRSFIVSKKHIEAVTASHVRMREHEIPIGVQFREEFFKKIGMV